MDSDEYFDRVLQYLQRNGWNTSRSQVNDETYLVTGTRKSETYYDRMLTLVVVEETTPLSQDHVEYLLDAGAEHDVDQIMATAQAGLSEEAAAMVADSAVEFVEPPTIDDAVVDEFSSADERHTERLTASDPSAGSQVVLTFEGRVFGFVAGLYLLIAVGVSAATLTIGVVGGAAETVAAVAPAAVLVVGPAAGVGSGTVVGWAFDGAQSHVGSLFAATVVGYLVLTFVVGVVAALLGETGASVIYATPAALVGTGSLAVVVGGLSVAANVVTEWSKASTDT